MAYGHQTFKNLLTLVAACEFCTPLCIVYTVCIYCIVDSMITPNYYVTDSDTKNFIVVSIKHKRELFLLLEIENKAKDNRPLKGQCHEIFCF